MIQLEQFEIELHQYDVRTDIDKLKLLLHPSFIEIGYSGKTYSYSEIINSLLAEPQPDYNIWSQNYEHEELSQNIILVTYSAARECADGALYRHSKRSSIWTNETGPWKIKFHQATPVVSFEKRNF